MRGWALDFDQAIQPSEERNNAERALFEQALTIDPNIAAAITGVAATYLVEFYSGWGNAKIDYDAKILGQADRAIALAPDDPRPYSVKSIYLALSRRFDEAVRVADDGLAVSPNFPDLYGARATAEISLGRFDEAKSDFQQAMRLSPHDPGRANWVRQLGHIEMAAGHPEAAIVEYKKALDAGDHSIFIYPSLAAAYALLGKMDEAKPYVAETLRLNPSFTIQWFREHASDISIRNEGLRKAGFAEE